MSPSHSESALQPVPSTLRRTALAAALVLLATASATAVEPEENTRDAEGAEVQMKGFISDLETLRMNSDPEGLELPKSEPPPAVQEPKAAPAPAEDKKTPETPKEDKPVEIDDLSRRSSPKPAAAKPDGESARKNTTADAKAEEKAPAKNPAPAKAPSFPPARVAKDSSSKSDSPVPAQLQKKTGKTDAPAVADKPAERTPEKSPKKITITESKNSRAGSAATARAQSPEKPAARVASAPSTARPKSNLPSRTTRLSSDPVLGRGDLTVSLAEGGVAAIRPSGRAPEGARYPASRVTRGSYTVEGRVAGLLPRPDGRLRVLVATRSEGTVQVVVSGRFAGESLEPGQHVRLQGERIGGSENHPVVEVDDDAPVSAVPRRGGVPAADPIVAGDPVGPIPMMDPFPMPGPAFAPMGPVGPMGPVIGPMGPMGPPPGW